MRGMGFRGQRYVIFFIEIRNKSKLVDYVLKRHVNIEKIQNSLQIID